MSDDKLYDKDGNVYQKNYLTGQFQRQWDFEHVDLEDQPVAYDQSGTPLFRKREAGGELLIPVLLFLVLSVVLLGPILLGGWLYHRGWQLQPKGFKWYWVLTFFVSALFAGWFGLTGITCIYFALGVIAAIIVATSQETNRAPFSLPDDEAIVTHKFCELARGLWPPPGELYLTNKRLIFMPILPFMTERLDLPLSSIRAVERKGRFQGGPWIGMAGNRIFLDLNDSSRYIFTFLGSVDDFYSALSAQLRKERWGVLRQEMV